MGNSAECCIGINGRSCRDTACRRHKGDPALHDISGISGHRQRLRIRNRGGQPGPPESAVRLRAPGPCRRIDYPARGGEGQIDPMPPDARARGRGGKRRRGAGAVRQLPMSSKSRRACRQWRVCGILTYPLSAERERRAPRRYRRKRIRPRRRDDYPECKGMSTAAA